MTDENNHIKTFTAADIEKYHRGQLSAKEMHALEKAALDDPFLADALEGYATPGVNIPADIAELKKRLLEQKEETKVIPMHGGSRSSFPWLRAAVMIVVLAGAALFSYQFFFNDNSNPISQLNKSPDNPAKTDKPGSTRQSATGNNDTVLYDKASSGSTNKAAETSVSGTLNLPDDNAAQGEVKIESKAFLNVNPDSGRIIGVESIMVEQTNAAATATAKPDDKRNKDLVIVHRENVTIDKKAEKERADFQDQFAHKMKTDSSDMALRKQRAAVNAVSGYSMDQNQQGVYRNNSTNIFRGQIMDVNNTPLPFANVTNARDNVGTTTDAKGYFVLVSPDSVMDVQVKSLGYENSRIRLHGNLANNPVKLQEDKSLPEKIIDTVKRNYAIRSRDGNLALEEPEPADGWGPYDSYLANNQNNVPEAYDIKKNSGSDAVELSFEVNKNGEPVNIRIEKSLCDKCDKEAIRLVKEGPKWKRKAKKGKRTKVTVPFIKTD